MPDINSVLKVDYKSMELKFRRTISSLYKLDLVDVQDYTEFHLLVMPVVLKPAPVLQKNTPTTGEAFEIEKI